MALTLEAVYSVRFGPKLPLPRIVQDNIAKLRITPAVYKPVKSYAKHSYKQKFNSSANETKNWR